MYKFHTILQYICYNQTGDISTLDGTPLKLVDKFTYLGSRVLSTEKDIDTRLTKAWTATSRLLIIWKSDLTDKMKRSFFQAAVVSILPYGYTTWTLTKRLEKKLDGNYTRMLQAILNKSWRQHPTRHQLYGHMQIFQRSEFWSKLAVLQICWSEFVTDIEVLEKEKVTIIEEMLPMFQLNTSLGWEIIACLGSNWMEITSLDIMT